MQANDYLTRASEYLAQANQYIERFGGIELDPIAKKVRNMPPDSLLTLAGGSALVLMGVGRRSKFGMLMALIGGGMVYRAFNNNARDYAAKMSLDKGTPTQMSIPHGEGIRVDKTIAIDKSPEELYRFWRRLDSLPLFMNHLESVTPLDATHSRWVAKAPAGMRVDWDAEIINEVENELISWRSVEGSDVPNAGSVHFAPTPNGRGTRVHVVLRYNPPAGKLGALFAKLFGEEPNQTVAEDLWRFKNLMESGQVPAAGSPPLMY